MSDKTGATDEQIEAAAVRAKKAEYQYCLDCDYREFMGQVIPFVVPPDQRIVPAALTAHLPTIGQLVRAELFRSSADQAFTAMGELDDDGDGTDYREAKRDGERNAAAWRECLASIKLGDVLALSKALTAAQDGGES